jgi:membrane associated rhomboid family serine protease
MYHNYYQPSVTGVVRILLIINIALFVVSNFILGKEVTFQYLAVYYPESPFFQPIQLLSYMFLHGGTFHIFFNMLSLYFFGPAIEYLWGPKQFLFYYFVTGFGALVLDFAVKFYQIHYMNTPPEIVDLILMTPTVGASGAIYGLLAAYAMLFPNNILQLIFPPIPIRAKYLVLILAGIELFSGIQDIRGISSSNVAHFAHLGGALFGALLILYWRNGGKLGK